MITVPDYRPEYYADSSCGSVVVAALLKMCCQEAEMIMDLLHPKGWNGYTNVGHIRKAVESKGIKMLRTNAYNKMTFFPESRVTFPLALFIQLEGPWEKKGWRSAYNYTHWALLLKGSAMDYNNRFSLDQESPYWYTISEWERKTMQNLVDGTEGCTGWHIRAGYNFILEEG